MSLQWDRDFAFEQAGEDEELLAELLDLLCLSSENDLDKIRKGADAGDAVAIGEAAHSIKGASSSLGLAGLRDVAYDMEKKGNAGDLDGALSHLPVLESMVSELSALK
jgi:HPt (histidine-containing phosphotransfer) domain-containing protein